MKRTGWWGICIIFFLVVQACSPDAPAPAQPSLQGDTNTLPAAVSPGDPPDRTQPSQSAVPTNPATPATATAATAVENLANATGPSETPPRAATATSEPDFRGQFELLTGEASTSSGIILDVTWQPGTENLLVLTQRELFLLDLSSGETRWKQPLGYDQVGYSSNGRGLFLTNGNQLQRLDPDSGQVQETTEFPYPEGLYTLSPEGQFLASTLGGDIQLLDLQTGQTRSLPVDDSSGPVYDMAFSADGKRIIAGSMNGDLQAWDAASGQRTLFKPAAVPSPFYDCQVSGARDQKTSGALIIACSYPASDGQSATYQVEVHAASSGAASGNLAIRDTGFRGYHSFETNADRSRVAAVVENDIEIWRASGSSRLRILTGAAGSSMAFHPKAASRLAVWDQRTIRVLDINSGQSVAEWSIPESASPIQHILFSPAPGPRLLVTARANGLVEAWNLSPLQPIAEWQGKKIAALAFSPDGAQLAVGQRTGEVFLFNISEGRMAQQSAMMETGIVLNALAFDPANPSLLYTAGMSHHVHIWDVSRTLEVGRLEGSNLFELTTLALHDGVLAAGTIVGRIIFWQATPGATPIADMAFSAMTPALTLNISADGSQVIFTQNNDLRVYDIRTKKRVQETFFRDATLVYAKPSPDGCSLAVQTRDAIELVDVATLASFSRLTSPVRLISGPAISPDGRILAAGSQEGSLLLWGAPGVLQTPNRAVPQVRCKAIPPPAPTPIPTITPRPSATLSPTATVFVTATATPTPPPFQRTLSLADPYMRGDDVLALQERLFELGYEEVDYPDGVYGMKTDQAVRLFQERNGLVVDGFVGPITWQHLFGNDAARR